VAHDILSVNESNVKVTYIAQPDVRLGEILLGDLASDPAPRRVVIVSAFAALQTIMRLKFPLLALRDRGCAVSLVLGLDMGGTSKEVLEQVATWTIPVTIVKNRIPGHTFHPKLYLLEWATAATIVVGSNNATEGGFFRNYESAACIEYNFPDDDQLYGEALLQLRRFLDPSGPVARLLTAEYLAVLLQRTDIPTEREARQRTSSQTRHPEVTDSGDGPFGSEVIAPPPPLSADLLERLIAGVTARRRQGGQRPTPAERAPETVPPAEVEQIYPAAFYMSLPTLQGLNIPGEARIPLAAIELAEEFWGWPSNYEMKVSPRAGQDRVYHEWKPTWRIWNVERPHERTEQAVRMYMYDNSSDFRFYARPLVNAGADLGDIVRIVRVGGPEVEFECALAKVGTPEHTEWQSYCTTPVRNSTRSFGYG
jgi:hypothetical protein